MGLAALTARSPCKGHKNLAGQKRHVHCGHSPCDSDSRRVLCVTSRAKLNVTNKREEPSVSCLRGLVLQAHSKMNTLNTLCSSQTGTTQMILGKDPKHVSQLSINLSLIPSLCLSPSLRLSRSLVLDLASFLVSA